MYVLFNRQDCMNQPATLLTLLFYVNCILLEYRLHLTVGTVQLFLFLQTYTHSGMNYCQLLFVQVLEGLTMNRLYFIDYNGLEITCFVFQQYFHHFVLIMKSSIVK